MGLEVLQEQQPRVLQKLSNSIKGIAISALPLVSLFLAVELLAETRTLNGSDFSYAMDTAVAEALPPNVFLLGGRKYSHHRTIV